VLLDEKKSRLPVGRLAHGPLRGDGLQLSHKELAEDRVVVDKQNVAMLGETAGLASGVGNVGGLGNGVFRFTISFPQYKLLAFVLSAGRKFDGSDGALIQPNYEAGSWTPGNSAVKRFVKDELSS
jgi:hypothetical protein